jgi:hypothetical protein
LRAFGTFENARSRAFEDLFDGEAGREQVFEQFRGVEAVRAISIMRRMIPPMALTTPLPKSQA